MKKITMLTTALCLVFAIHSAKAQTTPETNNPTSTGIRTGPTNTDPRPAQINAPSTIKPDNNQSNNPSGDLHNTGTNTSSAGTGRMIGTGSMIKPDKKTRDTTTFKP